MVIQCVLCPVDFSEPSRRALHYARAIAAWYESELDVVHVMRDVMPLFVPWFGPPRPQPVTDVRPATISGLNTFISETPTLGPVTGTVREGQPAAEILRYAAEIRTDLVVMATHGATGLDRILLGSTAERVLHKAACPVLTVPCRADEPGAADRARFTHVLCALDFSPMSMRALALGLSLAQENQARLTLLHVVEVPSDDELFVQSSLRLGEFIELKRNDALERFARAVPADAREWCEVSEMVRPGRPATVILEESDRRNVDLIVMGPQGRRGLALLLLGSTTQSVLHRATCPVLTSGLGPMSAASDPCVATAAASTP
jgi:nucleotide-binding universal stress UspA family protein